MKLWLVLAFALWSVHAEVDNGMLADAGGFAFISKFCFDYTDATVDPGIASGSFAVNLVSSAANPGTFKLLGFDDEATSWPVIQANGATMTCTAKSALAKFSGIG
jgi:hypothetical protein